MSNHIDSGNLGAVLQLLFLLSSYKQKLRQLKKDQKKLEQLPSNIMPPAVSKLPSPRVPPTSSNPNSNFPQMSTSRLQTPQSRISKPSDSSKIGIRPKTSGLKPPSASTSSSSSIPSNANSFRPSSRSSGNNNVGSTISTSAKSLDSSSTYSSISNLSRPTPSSQIQKPSRLQTQQVRVATTTKIGSSSKLAAPKAVSTPKLATVKTIKTETENTGNSGMLKLKLFSGKTSNSSNNSPQPIRKVEQSKIASPAVKTGLKPPSSSTSKLGSATSISKLSTPKINYRKPDSIINSDSKRCSKSSEEESGYAGFNSTSPASSSTEGSLNWMQIFSVNSHPVPDSSQHNYHSIFE
uniref:Flocculation protein FLO11-like n=1 Tax=Caenorhabditis tropicalis TaxID=1561998 RepID=A0A1I7U9W2_9PELO